MYRIDYYNAKYLLKRHAVGAPLRQRRYIFKYHNGYHFFFLFWFVFSVQNDVFFVFSLSAWLYMYFEHWSETWIHILFIFSMSIESEWNIEIDIIKITYIFLCIVNPIITSKATTTTMAREIRTTFDGSLHIELESNYKKKLTKSNYCIFEYQHISHLPSTSWWHCPVFPV